MQSLYSFHRSSTIIPPPSFYIAQNCLDSKPTNPWFHHCEASKRQPRSLPTKSTSQQTKGPQQKRQSKGLKRYHPGYQPYVTSSKNMHVLNRTNTITEHTILQILRCMLRCHQNSRKTEVTDPRSKKQSGLSEMQWNPPRLNLICPPWKKNI